MAGEGIVTTLRPRDFRVRSVERALLPARRRAADRAQRIVEVASVLIAERGGTDFTVIELLSRGQLSQRTFNRYFDGKSDLLRAFCDSMLHETLRTMETKLEAGTDALMRLHIAVDCLTDEFHPDRSSLHSRLMEIALRLYLANRHEYEQVFTPVTALLVELVNDLDDHGRLRGDVSAHSVARIILQVALASARCSIDDDSALTKSEVWEWCVGGFARLRHCPQASVE